MKVKLERGEEADFQSREAALLILFAFLTSDIKNTKTPPSILSHGGGGLGVRHFRLHRS